MMSTTPDNTGLSNKRAAPVGIYDSGIGGLSVLRHIRNQLPGEDLLYFADTGFGMIGDKPEAAVAERALAVAGFMVQQGVKALVVACNTATAAAIAAMRHTYPQLILVGVEPGLKPAAALSQSKVVGVLATRRTLESKKFQELSAQLSTSTSTRFLPQACIGLADQIEKGELQSAATATLINSYVQPLIASGADVLVLGCTHYPFVLPLIEQAAGKDKIASGAMRIVDTGEAVARQLARLLKEQNINKPASSNGELHGYTTASASGLINALQKLLKLQNAQNLVTALTLEVNNQPIMQ